MTVEIAKVREAEFYLRADLTWLTRQLDDERVKPFLDWLDALDHGCPEKILTDVTTYQAQYQSSLDGLKAIKAIKGKLQAELNGIEATISKTEIVVTDEVKRYLKEEAKEPDPGGGLAK